MKFYKLCLAIGISLVLVGCVGASHKLIGSERYSPHARKVLLTEETLPSSADYHVIGIVKMVKATYGSGGVNDKLANEARRIGADAVIGIERWRSPAGFAYAAPHARGEAVRLGKDFDISQLSGQWR